MLRIACVTITCLQLVGCGSSGGNGATFEKSPDGKTLIETEIAPDGSKVIEFTIRSGASGTLPAGMLPPDAAAEYARIASQVKSGEIGYYRYVVPKGSATTPVTEALPDVAGVPQTTSTKVDGTKVTKTFTYGTPPSDAEDSVRGGIVPAGTTAEAAKGPEPFGYCVKGRGVLQGGTSYCPSR